MLNEVINGPVNDAILSLNYLERVGGIILPATVVNGDTVMTYPIGSGFTSKPVTNRYDEYVPNDKFASLSYWTLGPLEHNVRIGAKSPLSFIAPLKLSIWLNLKRLGVNQSGFPTDVIKDIFRIFESSKTFTDNSVSIRFSRPKILLSNPQAVFGQFDFAFNENMFLWPYAYAGFDFAAEIFLINSCSTGFEPGMPINCCKI